MTYRVPNREIGILTPGDLNYYAIRRAFTYMANMEREAFVADNKNIERMNLD